MALPFSTDGIPAEIVTSLGVLDNDIPVHTRVDKGASGYVFLGEHKVLRQPRAIKYYYGGDEFHDEVRSLAELASPYILPIYDARTIEGGYAYFVTAVFEGGDLDDYIDNSTYSVKEAVRIAKEILSGAAELHGKRFVHRDLKPGNILMAGSGQPVIADFGSVRLIPEGQDFVTGSRHATLYRPPESWLDRYEFKSDVYQLGIVLYQLLGGLLPYDGVSYLNQSQLNRYHKLADDCDRSLFVDDVIRRKTESGTLLKLASLPMYVDSKLKRIISKAVHPEAEKRFASASSFRLRLHELGQPADWQIVDGNFYVIHQKGRDFRIVPNNGAFRGEACAAGSNKWRKVASIQDGDMPFALEALKRLL